MSVTKKVIIVIIIIIVVILISYTYYTQPKKYTQRIEGIRYQHNNTTLEEKVEIKVDGVYSKSLIGGSNFKGSLYIDDLKLYCSISDSNHGLLSYVTENGYTHVYGSIYIDDSFDKLAILSKQWSNQDGITIAAPAQNREEALRISNEVMHEFLINFDIDQLK